MSTGVGLWTMESVLKSHRTRASSLELFHRPSNAPETNELIWKLEIAYVSLGTLTSSAERARECLEQYPDLDYAVNRFFAAGEARFPASQHFVSIEDSTRWVF